MPAQGQSWKSDSERLKDIFDSIETGVQNLFESERYKQYLKVMSRFHQYSVNNTLLIYMQNPNATQVASFTKWKNQFSRNVKKGQKGIQIIAPVPYKQLIETPKLDPDTKLPMLDADNNVITELHVIQIPRFKPVFVFDASQTEGKPLPSLADELVGNVPNYEVFMEAVKRSSPVPIRLEQMSEDMDGYFSIDNQYIAIREGMSEVQTVCAAIHEIAHAKLHNYEKTREEDATWYAHIEPVQEKDRRTEEVEAESISYSVCAYFGIETGDNSFGYLANWSSGKELAELHSSLNVIGQTSSSLIYDIDRHYWEICKERGIERPPQQEYISVPAPIAEEDILPFADDYAKFISMAYMFDTVHGISAENVAELADFAAEKLRNHDLEPLQDALTSLGGILKVNGKPVFTNHVKLLSRLQQLDKQEYFPAQEDLSLLDEDKYLHVQMQGDGFSYTLYDKEDGAALYQGRLDALPGTEGRTNTTAILRMARDEILKLQDVQPASITTYPAEKVQQLLSEIAAKQPEQPTIPEPLEQESTVERSVPVSASDNGDVPDPTISVAAMNAYGYTDSEMLPLSKERAMELFERDIPVFMLYEGNSEGMVFEPEDVAMHSGLFGIFKADWDSAKDSVPAMAVQQPADIVVPKPSDVVSLPHADDPGHEKPPENYLKAAEMQLEDDYGMIDGIVNNGKAAAAQDHEEPKAPKREERPSVLAQLRDPDLKSKSEKAAHTKSAEMER